MNEEVSKTELKQDIDKRIRVFCSVISRHKGYVGEDFIATTREHIKKFRRFVFSRYSVQSATREITDKKYNHKITINILQEARDNLNSFRRYVTNPDEIQVKMEGSISSMIEIIKEQMDVYDYWLEKIKEGALND